MNSPSRSSIGYQSNLQPIKGSITDDYNFLDKIRDPFALYRLHEKTKDIVLGYHLSAIQQEEYKKASAHCAYAVKDDYPNGTVRNQDGTESVQCKCINIKCKRFASCRPDFQEEELSVLYDNDVFVERLTAFPILNNTHNDPDYRRDGLTTRLLVTPLLLAEMHTAKTINEYHRNEKQLSATLFTPSVNEESQLTHDTIEVDIHSIEPTVTEYSKKALSSAAEKHVGFASFVDASQESVIKSDITERIIVNAGPGTGKTWTLIEKLIYMVEDQNTDPEGILVLCFTRVAVEVIEQRLLAEAEAGRIGYGWSKIDIRTFDSFATYMIAWVQENYTELLPMGYSLDSQEYDTRIRMASQILLKKDDVLSQYQHVIIDEVQDLVGCRAEFVLKLLSILPESCGFTLLGDACQALYDYQAINDPAVMTSDGFYTKLFGDHDNSRFYSFNENHRQEGNLFLDAVPYRDAILTGTPDDRFNAVREINTAIGTSTINLQRVEATDLDEYIRRGTLGILTRTNGQALKISTWLKNANIPHVLQRPASTSYLGEWIAHIFKSYPNQTINEELFINAFLTSYINIKHEQAKKYWLALIGTQRGNQKPRYEVEELLRGLLSNARDKILFTTVGSTESITISNIHRAKGREFDSVLVIDDVLAYGQNDNVLEHKVCYVAITRPKKQLSKVPLKNQYIYIDNRDTNRRCFQAGGFGNRKYLSHIEIGFSGDLDMRSFAASTDVQDYIHSELRSDARLVLHKCPEGVFPYLAYQMVLEDNQNIILGYTGKQFADGIQRAIQRIYNVQWNVYYQSYPNTINDIYVDNLVTCISVSGKELPGAKTYGDISIWSGFTVSGFAQIYKDRY